LLEIFFEGIEPGCPELAVSGEPFACGLQGCGCQIALDDAAGLFARDEAGVFEDLEVLEKSGQRHVIRCRKLGDGPSAIQQLGKDAAPRSIRQRGEYRIEGAGLILNHLV
jgi:hypothetical protein